MARPRRDTPGLEARRREAIRLVLRDELSLAEAARRAGCHRSSVQRWVAAARPGPQRQRSTRKPGRPTKLTDKVKAALQSRLSGSPRRRRLDADHWTTELAVQQLRRLGQYEYTTATGAKILRALGFRRVRSRVDTDGALVPAHWIMPTRTTQP